MSPAMTLEEVPSKSRENSMRHGLSGAGVVLPEKLRVLVDRRRVAYAKMFPPVNQLDLDDIDSAALGWARFLECRSERTHRAAQRAGLAVGHWATLRRLDAQERARRLAYDPPKVVERLKSSLGGVHWLVEQWKLLRFVLESSPTGEWSPKQQERAQNLAGVDRLFRQDDPRGIRSGDRDHRLQLVDAHLDELQSMLADGELERLDEVARLETILGEHALHDPALEKMGLYEQRARRQYERSIQRLAERHYQRHPEQAPVEVKRGRRRKADRERMQELEERIDREIAVEGAEEAGELEIAGADEDWAGVPEGEATAEVEVPREGIRPEILAAYEAEMRALDAKKAACEARLRDPQALARVSDAEMKFVHPRTFEQVRQILKDGELDVDLETAVRGILGHRKIEAERTGIDPELEAITKSAERFEREMADRHHARPIGNGIGRSGRMPGRPGSGIGGRDRFSGGVDRLGVALVACHGARIPSLTRTLRQATRCHPESTPSGNPEYQGFRRRGGVNLRRCGWVFQGSACAPPLATNRRPVGAAGMAGVGLHFPGARHFD
ncbi:MAG: hypothetical protein U0800_21325 [Isosphaeraceae bacterium]